mmetsp:Transcript_16529/g.28011  ORF Transcript_16529/g.28011 Transcript_16529/m.28011 type:complete len:297 (-) Transcript_16529:1084-1974(-)
MCVYHPCGGRHHNLKNKMLGELVLVRRLKLPSSGAEIAVVSINRPDQLNCFNPDVCHQLAGAFRSLRQESDLVAVIFRGEGSSFCAGADLADAPDPLEQSSDLEDDLVNNPVHQMRQLRVPLIGALTGYVVTGGFELALACDILVGDETVVFRDTHCKFGLAPCWGLSQRLQQRVGPGRAKLASLAAIPVRAHQALQWGLLDVLVVVKDNHNNNHNKESSLDRAMAIAERIGKNNSTMVRRYKQAIDEGGEMTFKNGLQRERQIGLAHYLEIVGDGKTMANAKAFIKDENRPRSRL